jgi:hypothetical protein
MAAATTMKTEEITEGLYEMVQYPEESRIVDVRRMKYPFWKDKVLMACFFNDQEFISMPRKVSNLIQNGARFKFLKK